MRRKKQPMEIDTYTIGPSVCKNFADKELCHGCVAKGLFKKSICFIRPAGSVTVKNDDDQLRAFTEAVRGGTA